MSFSAESQSNPPSELVLRKISLSLCTSTLAGQQKEHSKGGRGRNALLSGAAADFNDLLGAVAQKES